MRAERSPGRVGVVHVRADNQQELCRMFVRPQEYYESPYPDIRGHYFKLDQFLSRFANDHSDSYFDTWHGFNIPGHIVGEFFGEFTDLTPDEIWLECVTLSMDKFYLIGTHDGDDDATLDHELVHATYYLDPLYRTEVNLLVKKFSQSPTASKLENVLKSWGYSDTTMDDEFNAYLSTTEEAYWTDEGVDATDAAAFWREGEPFRKLAADNETNRWLISPVSIMSPSRT